MSRHWIFQANPQAYDIDAALREIDQIWWRVPQHTSEVQAGDEVALWRSGSEAGLVGVGRVLTQPQARPPGEDNSRFGQGGIEADNSVTTRVLISVGPTTFISKEKLRALPDFAAHQILTAPMGTVFPLSDQQWKALLPHLSGIPDFQPQAGPEALPPVFAWEQRAKGVLPMPGGYEGYLTSARQVCRIVADLKPTPAELASRMKGEFSLSDKAAALRESFLRKMGLIRLSAGTCEPSEWTERWLSGDDNSVVIGLLHSRCRFIGEMLAECLTPRTAEELLAIVNEAYGLSWDTVTQINNRRGWLQSAALLSYDGEGRLSTTATGRLLLEHLQLHQPGTSTSAPEEGEDPKSDHQEEDGVESPLPELVETLAFEIEAASVESKDPDRFERAVRDGFEFLGFDAEWLGGSGRTDVILDAPLGRDESYRVSVDAKTTGSGSLPDHQVDWTTILEHRQRHAAQYSALVGPNPATGRLADRAANHGVAVLSALQLAGLCRQHARTPLGLTDYRALFETGGLVDTTLVDEQGEIAKRSLSLAAQLIQLLEARTPTFGRLKARDLWLIVGSDQEETVIDEDEIQELLNALASPLIRAVDGDPSSGYVLASSRKTTIVRLEALRLALLSGTQSQA